MPVSSAVIGEAASGCISFAVVIGNAVSKRRSCDVGLSAMICVTFFGSGRDVDHGMVVVTHCCQHPDDVVAVLFDCVDEVEASAAALGPAHDEQVGEAVAV